MLEKVLNTANWSLHISLKITSLKLLHSVWRQNKTGNQNKLGLERLSANRQKLATEFLR